MSTRDLTYIIGFDVGDTTALGTAATDMDKLAGAAEDLDQAPALELDVGNLEDIPADIDEVGTSLDGLETPVSNANTKLGGLRGVLGEFGLTSLGVGEAVALVGQFTDIATTAWDAYNTKTELTKQITEGVSTALLDTSGALDIISGDLEDLAEAASTPAEVLNASIWQGIEAEQGAQEVEKLKVALLDLGLGLDDVGGAVQSFEDFGGQFATALFQGNVSAEEFTQTLEELQAAGELPPIPDLVSFEEFSTAVGSAIESGDDWGEIVAALPGEMKPLAAAFEEQIGAIEQLNDAQENVDYETLMQQQLDAAQQSDTLRTALEEVRQELGADATVPEIWQAYTQRLLELEAAAEETDEALDGATEDRTGEVDVDLEQAREEAAALRGQMEEATEPRIAEVNAEVTGADEANDDLEDVAEDRDTTVTAEADTAQATTDVNALVDPDRTITTSLGLRNGDTFDDLINIHTADQTITVDIGVGSISLPTESYLRSLMTGGKGYIRIPVDTYPRNVARLGAAR